jgi:hypothetical protein
VGGHREAVEHATGVEALPSSIGEDGGARRRSKAEGLSWLCGGACRRRFPPIQSKFLPRRSSPEWRLRSSTLAEEFGWAVTREVVGVELIHLALDGMAMWL